MHVHGNNWAGIQNGIPDVLELTYINKKNILVNTSKNKKPFPIEKLDYPNHKDRKDYILNIYPFVN